MIQLLPLLFYHLGNIPQVIRSPESAGARIATMEPERAEEEEDKNNM
jgi:hypothetical protein